ncbi:MAG: class I SAM-dependent methyltransferase [Candidatus Moraniibacteriota bacterium]|nr:MAG: class I SAM-dependent methyltransferase [Candidatus Moranbacteria bacterium]
MQRPDNSREYWERVKPDDIVQGLWIEPSKIVQYLPRIEREVGRTDLWPWFYDVYDLGAGSGKLAKELNAVGHLLVKAVDINPAIAQLKIPISHEFPELLSLDGRVGDVTIWSQGFGKDSILRVERIDAVIAQAVMPSLLGDAGMEWKKMLDVAAMWIAPSGYLFLHDFMLDDNYYSPIARLVGEEEYRRHMWLWHQRYRNNQEAFRHLGLPKGGFIDCE